MLLQVIISVATIIVLAGRALSILNWCYLNKIIIIIRSMNIESKASRSTESYHKKNPEF
jgi:hypothetical protein